MNDRLYDAFEVCRAALVTGVPIEAALGLYPELAAELRPALEAWQAASILADSSIVPTIRTNRSRTRLLGRAAQLRTDTSRPGAVLGGLPRLAFASLAVMLVLLFGWGGLATASAQALPGDPLYRIKRASEDLRLRLAASQWHSDLETEFAERRSAEVRDLLKLGRAQSIEFTGVVRAQTADGWGVDGVRVRISPETELDGEIRSGVTIKVAGTTDPSGNVLARGIRLTAFPWEGTVEVIGAASWTIGGRVVRTAPSTAIASDLRVGDRVLALIDVLPDDSLQARSILYLGAGAPTPAPQDPGRSDTQDDGKWEFEGLVQAVSADAWIVAGQTLLVTGKTEFDGSPQVGDMVQVQAQTTAEGRLIALRIERAEGGDGPSDGGTDSGSSGSGDTDLADESKSGSDDGHSGSEPEHTGETQEMQSFSGQVSAISGDTWTIAGQQVVVNGDTDLEGDPGLNDVVNVEARMIDGRWVAEKIEKQ